MEFYNRVKDACHSKQLNLRDLLESLGIIYGTYKSARRYKHLPRADDALRIAHALGVTLEFLIEGNDPQENPLLTDIYVRLHSLSPHQLDAVQALILGFGK